MESEKKKTTSFCCSCLFHKKKEYVQVHNKNDRRRQKVKSETKKESHHSTIEITTLACPVPERAIEISSSDPVAAEEAISIQPPAVSIVHANNENANRLRYRQTGVKTERKEGLVDVEGRNLVTEYSHRPSKIELLAPPVKGNASPISLSAVSVNLDHGPTSFLVPEPAAEAKPLSNETGEAALSRQEHLSDNKKLSSHELPDRFNSSVQIAPNIEPYNEGKLLTEPIPVSDFDVSKEIPLQKEENDSSLNVSVESNTAPLKEINSNIKPASNIATNYLTSEDFIEIPSSPTEESKKEPPVQISIPESSPMSHAENSIKQIFLFPSLNDPSQALGKPPIPPIAPPLTQRAADIKSTFQVGQTRPPSGSVNIKAPQNNPASTLLMSSAKDSMDSPLVFTVLMESNDEASSGRSVRDVLFLGN